MISSREEEGDAGKNHTEISGRVGNVLVFDRVLLTRLSTLYVFIIVHIYVLYTFLYVLYLRFFKTIRGKKLETIWVFDY